MGLDAPQMEDEEGLRYMKHSVIILMVAVMALAGCGKKEASLSKDARNADSSGKTAEMPGKKSDEVQHKIMSFNLEGLTDKGTKNWDVKGDSAESISENQVKLNNIQAKAYGEDSQAVITADNGIYDKAKNNVTLETNVKATIESTQSGARGFIDLPDAAPGSSKSKKAGASAKKTKTVITCDGDVLFDYQNNHVYFNKNVKVVGEDGSIDADKITVNLNPATRKIEAIIAEGSVKMVRGENITYSEKATYVEADQKVALTGSPKLVVYQDGNFGRNFLRTSNASTGDSRSH